MQQNGIWTDEEAQFHQHSQNLADFLKGYLPKDTPVLDLGCGAGFYVNELNLSGFKAMGVDGFKLSNTCTDEIMVHDLTQPFDAMKKSSIICLEVGEHLPKEAQETLMQTMTGNCDKHLIMSWAEIGQPGIGHINCRDQQEVILDVESRGFTYLPELTQQVRATIEEHTSWFQRTLLIFERN